MNPVITIVGRPNVGKSTLFNRLTRSRDALVADFSGLTRDRHYGKGRIGERAFICVDTGGFEPVAKTGIVAEMAKQTKQAVAESDIIIFLVDGRLGMAPQDRVIADFLRKTGRPVILAVNKTEGMQAGVVTADFHELGLGEPFPISSAHGDGVRGLIDDALDSLGIPEPEPEELENDPNRPMKIAVVGRPNVGKSTLINKLISEERVIAFDMPGTTRDAIEVPFERNGKPYILIDTAGLRRRGKVFEAIEKFSVVKTLQAIADCNVVILMLDAQQDVADQDAHLAGFIKESGRALVVAINKWDGMDAYDREQCKIAIERRFKFLDFASFHYISAKEGKRHGIFRPKPRYAHQGGMNPPLIVIHGNALNHIPDSYRRYLEHCFRDHFHLQGTPLRVQFNVSHNPYADD
ncbi:MAG: small GTP-binding protein [Pseudomonadota bacterium]